MSKSVLIVDDSRVSRMLARAYLEEMRPDWVFFEAANGEEAIAIAQKEAIELITLDVNMPGMSGLAAGERILQLRPGICIVVLTANVQSSVRQRAEALGMHFLQKPVTETTITHLLELVEGA
ncbi:response regulator [Chitinimonas sp.]|uniref:response regulator transcription factor n=1 Tax=Chitinimonas sp. TaxID=1934313 RepID=UPI002F939B94